MDTVCYIGFCVFAYLTRDKRYDLLYGHWVLRLAISHTSQGVRFLRALGSASCDISYETAGTFCYGHWACDITHEIGARFVTGIEFWVLGGTNFHRDWFCVL